MTFFPWREEYSVGVDELDAQHKKLVKLIDDLYRAMKAGDGREALVDALDRLMLYCKTHFETEERLLARYGYPESEAHKAKHAKMTQQVVKLRGDYRSGKLTSPIQITNFLKGWLSKHIQGTDRRYAGFLQNGVSSRAGDAYLMDR